MLNFNDFKYMLNVDATLESINSNIKTEDSVFESVIIELNSMPLNESKDEGGLLSFVKNPGGAIEQKMKDIPVIGTVVAAANNIKAMSAIKKAKEEYKKALTSKEADVVKFWIMVDKAKENGKKKYETPGDEKEAVKKITDAWDEKITAANTDWDDAIGEIKDTDLNKEKSAEKKSEIAHMKADIAMAYRKKFGEIAAKKLGYTDEQIEALKQKSGEADKGVDDLTKELDSYNQSKTKDMSNQQKTVYNAAIENFKKWSECKEALGKAGEKGYKEKTDDATKEEAERFKDYGNKLSELISALEDKNADKYDDWAKSDDGKKLLDTVSEYNGKVKLDYKFYVTADENEPKEKPQEGGDDKTEKEVNGKKYRKVKDGDGYKYQVQDGDEWKDSDIDDEEWAAM